VDAIDELKHLAVSDRLRVAAGLIDDAVAGRIDRYTAIKRVLDIVSLAVRTLIKELYRGGQPCSID
jgi:hypothetical protein